MTVKQYEYCIKAMLKRIEYYRVDHNSFEEMQSWRELWRLQDQIEIQKRFEMQPRVNLFG